MASRTTTDPIEILLEMGIDLDNLSEEEDYLSALKEAIATILYKTKGKGNEKSTILIEEVVKIRKSRKVSDTKFKAKKTTVSTGGRKALPFGIEPKTSIIPRGTFDKPEEEEKQILEKQIYNKSDLAKFPFIPEAAEYAKELGWKIEDLNSEMIRVIERAENRIEQALSNPPEVSYDQRDEDIEIFSLPIILVTFLIALDMIIAFAVAYPSFVFSSGPVIRYSSLIGCLASFG